MKILIATHNPGKIDRFKNLLKNIENTEIVLLKDIDICDEIGEPFHTSQENALYKSQEYAKLSGLITVAVDDSASTNFLPENEQPGVFLKRFSKNKKELNDEQIMKIWKEIFKKYPQEGKKFMWNSSIAYCNPMENSVHVTSVKVVSYVVSFSNNITPGYPMGSFLSPVPYGKPYSEFTEQEKRSRDEKVFAEFIEDFRQWLNNFPK